MSKIKHKFLQTQQTRNKGAIKDHLVQPLILWLGTQICYTFFPQIVPDRSVLPRESCVPHLLPKILTTFPIILSLYNPRQEPSWREEISTITITTSNQSPPQLNHNGHRLGVNCREIAKGALGPDSLCTALKFLSCSCPPSIFTCPLTYLESSEFTCSKKNFCFPLILAQSSGLSLNLGF